jgi:sec-independent protein translocase protein TatB
MFDFAWSEIALIGVVALIAIGPKDLPVAMRTMAQMVKKARRMASEFQTHVDDLMREANLDEVRQQINEIRNFDIKGQIERAVDADGSLRQTLASNPLMPDAQAPAATLAQSVVAETPANVIAAPEGVDRVEVGEDGTAEDGAALAFLPPQIADQPKAPAFVPPDITRF